MAVSCRDRTTRMVKPMSAPLSVIVLSLAVHGQAAAQVSIRDGAIADWTRLKDTMMKISEAMPEDEFGYRATPPERSFANRFSTSRKPTWCRWGGSDRRSWRRPST
jgi:hypothetical protein